MPAKLSDENLSHDSKSRNTETGWSLCPCLPEAGCDAMQAHLAVSSSCGKAQTRQTANQIHPFEPPGKRFGKVGIGLDLWPLHVKHKRRMSTKQPTRK